MKIITAERNLELIKASHEPIMCFGAGLERTIKAVAQVALNALALLVVGLFVSKEKREELVTDLKRGIGHLTRGIMEVAPIPSYIFFNETEKFRNLDLTGVRAIRPGEEDAAFWG